MKTQVCSKNDKKTHDKFVRNSRKALEDIKKSLKKETDEEKKKELTTKKILGGYITRVTKNAKRKCKKDRKKTDR